VAKANKKNPSSSFPGQVRIIAGQWRGRRLHVIESPGFRPTPNRVKETVFNWLQPYITGARCLDLFAGSGALCLEALSRGAGEVVMVEKDPRVAANLQQNIDMLKARSARLVNTDAMSYLARGDGVFDIVFVDPPFAESGLIDQSLAILAQTNWLKPGALVYVEASSALGELAWPDGWSELKSKKAGQVGYHLLQAPVSSGGLRQEPDK